MRCRQCGTEIADKALICYRCGTATTEAKFKPVAPSGGRSSRMWIVPLIIALLIAAAVAYFVWGRAGVTQNGKDHRERQASPGTAGITENGNDRPGTTTILQERLTSPYDPSRLDVCRDRIDLYVAAA